MRGRTNLRHPTIGRIRRAVAALAAGLFLSGCGSSKPVSFRGPTDIRSVEVALADLPPMEAYYHRRHPPGRWSFLGATPYTFMPLTMYRSWADDKETEQLKPHLLKLDAGGEMLASFVETLRQAGVFRRVERRGAQGAFGSGGLYDARIDLEVDRWGFTYATEGKLAAEVVLVGRMRPAQGEKLLWRRELLETDGARATLEELANNGEVMRAALRRTLRAAAADLARDLTRGLKPQHLIPPEL
ncbi:MAG: hypothetical protein IH975_01100 [Nitrospinae bacterium]|nr:hypothetical protein [Nitrospinota bacterium]